MLINLRKEGENEKQAELSPLEAVPSAIVFGEFEPEPMN
jgi:hypothetical protein